MRRDDGSRDVPMPAAGQFSGLMPARATNSFTPCISAATRRANCSGLLATIWKPALRAASSASGRCIAAWLDLHQHAR